MQRSPRKPAAQWAELVAEFQASGETERQFCQRNSLVLRTFRKWRYRQIRSAQSAQLNRKRGAFVEVTRPVAAVSDSVILCVGDDIKLECPVSMGIESLAQLALAVRHGR